MKGFGVDENMEEGREGLLFGAVEKRKQSTAVEAIRTRIV